VEHVSWHPLQEDGTRDLGKKLLVVFCVS
jgi:hypothetical protein